MRIPEHVSRGLIKCIQTVKNFIFNFYLYLINLDKIESLKKFHWVKID